jgi:hypothetical protein
VLSPMRWFFLYKFNTSAGVNDLVDGFDLRVVGLVETDLVVVNLLVDDLGVVGLAEFTFLVDFTDVGFAVFVDFVAICFF